MNTSRLPIFFTVVLIACLVAPQAHAAQTINDTTLGFTLTLPDAFKPAPRFVGAQPDIVHAFEVGQPDRNGISILLLIERMRGTLGRERLSAADLPNGAKGALLDSTWDGFDVQGFELHETISSDDYITFNVQIPLKREAIQVKLFGAASRRAELDQLLPQILAGLKGESNWLRSAVTPAVNDSPRYGTLLLLVAIVGVSAGFIGVLIAVVYMVRKRKPAPASEPNQTSSPSASP